MAGKNNIKSIHDTNTHDSWECLDNAEYFTDFSDSVSKSRAIGYFADQTEYELVSLVYLPVCLMMFFMSHMNA